MTRKAKFICALIALALVELSAAIAFASMGEPVSTMACAAAFGWCSSAAFSIGVSE